MRCAPVFVPERLPSKRAASSVPIKWLSRVLSDPGPFCLRVSAAPSAPYVRSLPGSSFNCECYEIFDRFRILILPQRRTHFKKNSQYLQYCLSNFKHGRLRFRIFVDLKSGAVMDDDVAEVLCKLGQRTDHRITEIGGTVMHRDHDAGF